MNRASWRSGIEPIEGGQTSEERLTGGNRTLDPRECGVDLAEGAACPGHGDRGLPWPGGAVRVALECSGTLSRFVHPALIHQGMGQSRASHRLARREREHVLESLLGLGRPLGLQQAEAANQMCQLVFGRHLQGPFGVTERFLVLVGLMKGELEILKGLHRERIELVPAACVGHGQVKPTQVGHDRR